MGMGRAGSDGILLLVMIDGSTEKAVRRTFDIGRERIARCSPASNELFLDLIGEESYALPPHRVIESFSHRLIDVDDSKRPAQPRRIRRCAR